MNLYSFLCVANLIAGALNIALGTMLNSILASGCFFVAGIMLACWMSKVVEERFGDKYELV
jgi:hypothetical protein